MFSKKFGYASPPAITFRTEAPEALRFEVAQAAHQSLSFTQIRTCICRATRQAPDLNNWSEIPNIRDEVYRLLEQAEWFQVYDAIEKLVAFIGSNRGHDQATTFVNAINEAFIDLGAGWQLTPSDGILFRGDALFEDSVNIARSQLAQSGFAVAEQQLHEALRDISRRPEPDVTGAVHHALGALESTSRYVLNSEKALGDLIPLLSVPKPLDQALQKLWGYSSNFGRHVSPTNVSTVNDAMLVVHISGAICRYLADDRK